MMLSPRDNTQSQRYVWAFRFCIVLLSTVISLLFFEMGLRTYKPIHGSLLIENLYNVRSDEQLYEPKSDVWIFNHDGIADPRNITTQKDTMTFRTEIIGDSLAFGLGLQPTEKYSYQLEKKLNEYTPKSHTHEVINLGVSGYNIAQVIARLSEKGLKYHPNVVIYHMWLDDVYISDPGYASAASNPLLRLLYDYGGIDNHKTLKHIFYKIFDLQIVKYYLYYSQLTTNASITNRLTSQPKFKNSITPDVQSRFDSFSTMYTSGKLHDLSWSESYFKSFANPTNFEFWNYYLSKLSTICQTQHIECAILLTPVLYKHAPSEYNWAALHQLIEYVANTHNIYVIDVTSELDQYNGEDLRLPGNTDVEHPNAFAQTLISDRLVQYILGVIKTTY